ncbi:MAG: endolytic transglycosylase MltG [Ornithinimicrobium sp.]
MSQPPDDQAPLSWRRRYRAAKSSASSRDDIVDPHPDSPHGVGELDDVPYDQARPPEEGFEGDHSDGDPHDIEGHDIYGHDIDGHDIDRHDIDGHDIDGHDREFDHAADHEAADAYDHLDPSDDLLVGSHEDDHDHERRRRRSPFVRWGSIVAALAVVAVGGYFALQVVSGLLPSFQSGEDTVADYPGPGGSEVAIEVPEGAGGGQIAEILAANDVVASPAAFAAAAAVNPDSVSIQPGSYSMLEQMSAEQALERMLDPEFRNVNGVTVREGLWKAEVFALLADQTDNEIADYEGVDPADLDLPDAAGGEMEGYLFPDTYAFGPDDTPQEQLQQMVELGKQKYADLGLEGDALSEAIIKGSLIQAEGAFSDDLPKIARVIDNRLAEDQPLGFDSTVHFIFQERGRAGTSDRQRDSDSPYNTYKVVGLPPGPINSPGTAAIEAAMNPAEGPWLYFVTTNPSTGETKFAVTFEEHNQNVAEFQRWCADNPDDC